MSGSRAAEGLAPGPAGGSAPVSAVSLGRSQLQQALGTLRVRAGSSGGRDAIKGAGREFTAPACQSIPK